jgi:hypothetical protein
LKTQNPGKKLEVVTGILGHLSARTCEGLDFFQMDRDGCTFASYPVSFTERSRFRKIEKLLERISKFQRERI